MKQSKISQETKHRILPYARRWYVFAISIVLCLSIAWLYLSYVTPIYSINSTLLIIDDKKGDGILKATAFSDLNMFQETKTVDNEIEILRSKDLIEKVLRNLKMDVSYFIEEPFKRTELYGRKQPIEVIIVKKGNGPINKKISISSLTDSTFNFQYGKVSIVGSYNLPISQGGITLKINRRAEVAQFAKPVIIELKNVEAMAAMYSDGKLQVNPVIKESNTLRVSTTDAIPERGVAILSHLIQTYNQENIERKNEKAMGTVNFIDQRLKILGRDLSGVEGEVENYKQQNGVTEIAAGTQVNLNKSAEYGQLIETNNIQVGVINTLANYLNNPDNQFRIVPSMGLKDPVLNTLVTRFNDLQMERNRMLSTAKLTNPLVEELTEQVNGLKQSIRENLANVKKGVQIEQDFLKSNSSRYTSRIRSVPALERGLLQRGREQTVKTNLYEYLLQKREETALSLSATIPSSEVIDRPAVGLNPDFPKKQLTYLLGGILGFLIPLGSIYAAGSLRPKVISPASLYEIKGVKILGELTHHATSNPIAVKEGSTTVISELFRFIRMNIGHLDKPGLKQTILVTSCMQGEGKTFVSINLGLTLAQLNKKVLILEFDLRKPDLLNKLEMTQKNGIATFLSGQTDELRCNILPYSGSTNLDVLGCGPLPNNPAELLFSERVGQLFKNVKELYDYVIIDTSPVGYVADAFSLAAYADLSIFLVRYNYTNLSQLQILKDINENNKLGNMMVVLNDAKQGNRSAYAYGGYGYGQGRHSV
ncbi:MAG: polysaccharide biosynthesis tyrosine autokinase [Pedobacter sp.]|nr:MAG: polysaccharide biosynthesis tyrosine autokinase [Pedobacter sp.]